ncbi:MAG: hypothetical protein K0S53_2104 [Bacteroidetes bacterium]|jgi:uncharacterized repeat protein (TIGR03803 family)|nr:hypothetical protein [Bacteroidota bacterium]MDF2452671.1 hypothetical protein [Bacteroidota bacterium]
MKKIVLFLGFLIIALTQNAQTELWGMTYAGGQYNAGTIFKTDSIGNNLVTVYHFDSINGCSPNESLLLATDGKLYGTTRWGGIYNGGVLFQYDPISNISVKKFDFDFSPNGSEPGSLIEAPNGFIYGITDAGGQFGVGVLFKYSINTSTFTKEIDFDGINGAFGGHFLRTFSGTIYSVVEGGGTNSHGTLFDYDFTNNVLTKKMDFLSGFSGSSPKSLIQASDSNLYGIASFGGANNKGSLFKYDLSNDNFIKKYDFNNIIDGQYPIGGIIQGSNGYLYGMTFLGGVNDMGVLFEYNILNDNYIKRVDFTGNQNGSMPWGGLLKASNGNLYGMAKGGGVYGKGTFFQYSTITNTLIKKFDFDSINGSNPLGGLIEVNILTTKLKQNISESDLFLYPNPNNGSFTIDLTSKSHVSVTNVLGEIIYDQSLETGKQNIDIRSQSNGFYFVRVTDVKGIISTNKIVVSN